MKLWLDDIRKPPKGWVWVKTPKEATKYLETGEVTEASLDHDLGLCIFTGYNLLEWIEAQVFLNGFKPPKLRIHTSNPSARVKMELAVKKIRELWKERINE